MHSLAYFFILAVSLVLFPGHCLHVFAIKVYDTIELVNVSMFIE